MVTDADFDELKESFDRYKKVVDTLLVNLLQPALDVPGTLRFGGNVMQLDNNGAQVLTRGAAKTAFFFFDDKFQPNPNSPTNPSTTPFSAVVGITDRDAAQPYSSVSFDSFSGTATSELKAGTEDDTNDNAYTQSYVNVGSDIATVRHDMDAGRTFAQLILSNTVLELASFTADPGTLNNGDVWYNSTTNLLKARINGSTVTLGGTLTTLLLTDTAWAAKGDLAVGTGNDTAQILSVGADNQVLTADSTQTTGVKWATPSSGGVTRGHTYAQRQGVTLQ